MKRFVVCFFVALFAFGMLAAVASATHSNGEGPDKDFTNGTTKGMTATPFGTFPSMGHVNAATDPGSPTCTQNGICGTFTLRLFLPSGSTVQATGDITCLTATTIGGTNSSVYAAVLTSQEGQLGPFPSGSLVGFRILARTIDNGEGANDPPDENGGLLTPPGPPFLVCPALALATLPQPQGNVTVHDGI